MKVILAAKSDILGSEEGLVSLTGEYGSDFSIISLSVQAKQNTETLPQKIFEEFLIHGAGFSDGHPPALA